MAKKSPASDPATTPKAPRARRAKGPVSVTTDADAAQDSSAAVTLPWAPTEQDVRVRAYHLYLERAHGQGTDLDDWVRAEQELHKR